MVKRSEIAIAAVACGVVAAFVYRNATLNHFYRFGAGTDAFWFAGLVWHMGPRMIGPISMGPGSFFATHVSPILYLPGALSWWFGEEPVVYFAGVMGVFHGLATTAMCAAIGAGAAAVDLPRWPVIAGVLLGGVAIIVLPLHSNFSALPHYEILMPAFLILFLLALSQRDRRLAVFWFVLLLSTREDAGLHAATFLLAWAAGVWFSEWRMDWGLLRYAGYGVACAVAAFLIGPIVAGHEAQGIIFNLYLGRPLFVHMTIDQVAARLDFFAYQLAHIWAPLVAIGAFAVWRRDWILIAGPVAVIPWITLNVGFGAHSAPAGLAFYYGFPILVAMMWPSIVAAMTSSYFVSARGRRTRSLLLLQAAVLALGFVPKFGAHLPHYGSRWAFTDLVTMPSRESIAAHQLVAGLFASSGRELGEFVAGFGVIGLAPTTISRRQWAIEVERRDAVRLSRIQSVVIFDSVSSCQIDMRVAQWADLTTAYDIRGTRLTLLTERTMAQMPSWAPLLVDKPLARPFCHDRAPTP
jgi:hypothetical protein